MTKKKAKQTAEQPKHVLTTAERAAIETNLARLESKTTLRLKIENGKIRNSHPDQVIGFALLQKALGSTDNGFVNGLLLQLANANLDLKGQAISETALNFAVAVINGIEPRDQLEAMLAAQMAAVHAAAMKLAQQLALSDTIVLQDSAERAFNKLTRTFATQLEAFKRYRSGGEQKVTVQHVSVSEGGQAIVGNVTQNSRQPVPDSAVTAPALTHSKTQPMKMVGEAEATPVPVERKSRK